jgi:WD40 repeat protein
MMLIATKIILLTKLLKVKFLITGHMMSIPSIALHPRKSILATASDDYTWKIWTIPQGDLIMSGEGHKDWVSGIAFHPRGSHLATSSGDCTIKIWDFMNASCSHTFKEH